MLAGRRAAAEPEKLMVCGSPSLNRHSAQIKVRRNAGGLCTELQLPDQEARCPSVRGQRSYKLVAMVTAAPSSLAERFVSKAVSPLIGPC